MKPRNNYVKVSIQPLQNNIKSELLDRYWEKELRKNAQYFQHMFPALASALASMNKKPVKVSELEKDDVRSTAMGQNGEDIQLSPKAREFIPLQIECKNKKEVSVINWLEQAKTHGDYTPVVIAKQDYSDPVVVIDAQTFFKLLKDAHGSQGSN